MLTKTLGRSNSEPQTLCLPIKHSHNFSQCYKNHWAIWRQDRKREFRKIIQTLLYRHSGKFFSLAYYVNINGSGEFFQSRLQSKSARAIFFFSIECLHKCGTIFTRFHASVFSSSMVFVWRKIMGKWLYISYARR